MDSTNPEPTTICTDRRTLLRGIAVSGALVGAAGTAGATPSFGACRTVRRSGTYTLTRDIGGDRAVCLRITADNVTLRGRGHTVRGPGTFDGNVGILVRGDRVTIRNVEVVDWETGIRFDDAAAGAVHDCTVDAVGPDGIEFVGADRNLVEDTDSNGEDSGIELNGSHQNTLRYSRFTADAGEGIRLNGSRRNNVFRTVADGTDRGIVATSSRRNIFARNVANDVDVGMSLSSSHYNSLRGNRVKRNDSGVVIRSSDHNRLTENVVTDNDGTGVLLQRADDNELVDNVVRRNRVGLALFDADDNVVRDNSVCANSDEQVVADDDSTGNRFDGNDLSC